MMERQVGVSAVTVIVALLVGASLLGLVGALLAVPTAAIPQVLFPEAVLRDEDDAPEIPVEFTRASAAAILRFTPPHAGGEPMAVLSDSETRRLRAAFQAIVGAEAVVTGPSDLLVYESDGLTVLGARFVGAI